MANLLEVVPVEVPDTPVGAGQVGTPVVAGQVGTPVGAGLGGNLFSPGRVVDFLPTCLDCL